MKRFWQLLSEGKTRILKFLDSLKAKRAGVDLLLEGGQTEENPKAHARKEMVTFTAYLTGAYALVMLGVWFLTSFTIAWQILVLYTIASIRIVWFDEVAAKTLFFGKAFQHCGRGLVIVPFGICGLVKLTGLQVRKEVPGEPSKIFRGDGATPEGLVSPIRITAKAGEKKVGGNESDDPLESKRVVYEIAGVVGFQIDHAPSFITAIGTTEKALEFLEDEFARKAAEELQGKTYAEALKDHRVVGGEIATTVETATETWGVKTLAYLKPPSGNHELNKSITGVAQAAFEGKATVIRGETEGKAAKAAGVDPNVIVGARVAEKLAAGASNTIVTGENPIGQLIAALKTATKQS